MRDRNQLSYQQFYIQLEKTIFKRFQELGSERNSFSHELSLEFRPEILHSEFWVVFQRDFRLLRALSIIQWYLPENLHFLTLIQLENESLSWLNWKQKVEISIFLNSKDSMLRYLYFTERYSGNEIFGNFLGNDLKDLSRTFKVTQRNYPRPKKKIFRRGPKDKGSRRVISVGPMYEKDVRSDVFLQEKENQLKRKEKTIRKLVNLIVKILKDIKV